MEGKASPVKTKKKVMISKYWQGRFPSQSPLGLILILMALIALSWFYFASNKPKNKGSQPVSIVAGTATTRDVPIYIAALGTVTPIYTVAVQSQISGILMKVLFKEGQLVKKGQLLAQIDPRLYEALLTQYEGNLKRDSALLANARIDLKRYQKLWQEDSISQQTLATQHALVEQYEGNVKTDFGLIQSTKVNLIYCNITSPVDGRIGLRLIDPGNLVQTSNTQGIAVVTTMDPMTVIFPIAEDYVPQIAQKAYRGKEMNVSVYDRQQEHLLAQGTLLALDNQISTTTGTLKLRAVFNNEKKKLFPNQFVNVKIRVDMLHDAIVIPTAAVQHTTTEDFVYIIKSDHTVSTQKIVMGPTSGDDTVIKSGLLPGQEIVINGADKLINGSKVFIQAEQPANTPVKTADIDNFSLG